VPAGHRVSHFGVTVSPLRGSGAPPTSPGTGPPASPGTGATEPRGAICLFSDLTAVVELEEQLRLKDTLARLGELTAGIAHEFRNGLATIHGYSRLMTPQGLPEAYRPYVAGIRDETEALGRVITNFLNFARPDRVVFSRVDLGPLVARAIEEMRHDVPEGEVTMRGTFAQIDGDEVLLRQMLMNLVRNSLDACRDAGRTPAVIVEGRVEPAERLCSVTVEDNGPGIAAEVRDHIFTPFFTTKAKGTGLGLSIVQKIAVTHNGRVAASGSPVLGGARVEVTLPLPDGV
jgi:signal transduction histidine kinase